MDIVQNILLYASHAVRHIPYITGMYTEGGVLGSPLPTNDLQIQ